jgi:hypothetical protein
VSSVESGQQLRRVGDSVIRIGVSFVAFCMFSACRSEVGIGQSSLDNGHFPVAVNEVDGGGGDYEFAPTADAGEAEDAADDGASSDDGGIEGGAIAECDLDGGPDGGCTSSCTSDRSNICTVILDENDCELIELAGAFATVGCGQSATVGTASCGGCGSVAVEVYYDGARCWEGIPDCTLPQFTGKFFDPHAPGVIDAGVAHGVDAATGADASTDADAGTTADADADDPAADAASDVGADQGD